MEPRKARPCGRVFGRVEFQSWTPDLYNENKKVLLTQVDTVSGEKGRTVKTQIGEETNVANRMSSLWGCCVLPETKVPGQRDCTGLGDQSRRRPPEADESSLCTGLRQLFG